jgi:hypothetical protein
MLKDLKVKDKASNLLGRNIKVYLHDFRETKAQNILGKG